MKHFLRVLTVFLPVLVVVGVTVFGSVEIVSAQNVGNSKSELMNPLQANDIQQFLLAIIEIILYFAVPIIVIYIMYAGYMFVTANGNAGQVETARRALLYALVGGVIVLGAKIILEIIQNTVTSLQ